MKGLGNIHKIKFPFLIVIMSLVFLAPGGAAAYTETIADSTFVLPYRGTSPSTYSGWTTWTDVIASTPSAWNIKQVAVTWSGADLKMQIYTNYPQAGLEGAGAADIALDPNQNGSWNVGVKMSGNDLGKIYAVTSWVHPQDNTLPWNNGSYIYGGQYDQVSPKTPSALIGTTTNNLGTATVNWFPLNGDTVYRIDVIFPANFNVSGLWNNFNFEVGSGSCGNEVMAGSASSPFSGPPVPIPGSVLLLGTGLLGLGLLGFRQKAAPVKIK
jgi:hypothetical protein